MVSKKSSRNGPKITAREGDGGHEIAHESSGCTFLSSERKQQVFGHEPQERGAGQHVHTRWLAAILTQKERQQNTGSRSGARRESRDAVMEVASINRLILALRR